VSALKKLASRCCLFVCRAYIHDFVAYIQRIFASSVKRRITNNRERKRMMKCVVGVEEENWTISEGRTRKRDRE
jgi:hypothetical protein